jgi:hypothetical protein
MSQVALYEVMRQLGRRQIWSPRKKGVMQFMQQFYLEGMASRSPGAMASAGR